MAHQRRLRRSDILRALTRLGDLCAQSQTKVELAIYGGTVMMFAFDCRAATKDVDAVFSPPEVVEPLIAQVAQELNLPADWMNNSVRDFVGAKESLTKFSELAVPGLMITRPSADYLLAMKCMAARLPTPFRPGDIEDLRFLLRKQRISSIAQVDATVAEFYSGRVLEGGKRWLVEKLIDEIRAAKRTRK